MLWIISYDIIDDNHRRRVAKILEGQGMRVQYSVFECRLNAKKRKQLTRLLKAEIDPEEDSLRWYPQCNHCLPHAKTIGRGIQAGEGADYLIV